MAINTPIDHANWPEFFGLFSNGNRGREISIEKFDTESGSTGQVRQGPLMAVDYDPVGKGNDIVITTGIDSIDYSHTIKAPVEVMKEQLDNGEVKSLQIIDQNNGRTVISF